MIILDVTQNIPTSLVDEDGNSVALLAFAMIGLSMIGVVFYWFKKRIDTDAALVKTYQAQTGVELKLVREDVTVLSKEINALHKLRVDEARQTNEELFRHSAQLMGVLQNNQEIVAKATATLDKSTSSLEASTEVIQKIFAHASKKLGL